MKLKNDLLPHQAAAVEKLSKIKVGALFMEQGTGKTITTLELARIRLEAGKIERVIWLCPCSAKGNIKREIVKDCPEEMLGIFTICGIETLFKGEGYLPDFLEILDKAVELSGNTASDSKNIRELGGGWTGEEAFAIAIYCALRYHNDFSKAIVAAVNHSGDSDSTGAITGNIVGAAVGYEGIDGKWKQHLEFGALLVGLASELLIS